MAEMHAFMVLFIKYGLCLLNATQKVYTCASVFNHKYFMLAS